MNSTIENTRTEQTRQVCDRRMLDGKPVPA